MNRLGAWVGLTDQPTTLMVPANPFTSGNIPLLFSQPSPALANFPLPRPTFLDLLKSGWDIFEQ